MSIQSQTTHLKDQLNEAIFQKNGCTLDHLKLLDEHKKDKYVDCPSCKVTLIHWTPENESPAKGDVQIVWINDSDMAI